MKRFIDRHGRTLIALCISVATLLGAVLFVLSREEENKPVPLAEIVDLDPADVDELIERRSGRAFWLGPPQGKETLRTGRAVEGREETEVTSIAYLRKLAQDALEQDPAAYSFLVTSREIPRRQGQRLRKKLRRQSMLVLNRDGFRIFVPPPLRNEVRGLSLLSDDLRLHGNVLIGSRDASAPTVRSVARRVGLRDPSADDR